MEVLKHWLFEFHKACVFEGHVKQTLSEKFIVFLQKDRLTHEKRKVLTTEQMKGLLTYFL